MRWLALLAVIASFNASAYSKEQDLIVQDIVREAKAKGYHDSEIKWAIRSNTFEVPNMIICAYLPKLSECQ